MPEASLRRKTDLATLTENLTFRDSTSDGVAGAVITVLGAEKSGGEHGVETYTRHVTVENCTLERSGKFMWDYGYLWQITVWPEDYPDTERAMGCEKVIVHRCRLSALGDTMHIQ